MKGQHRERFAIAAAMLAFAGSALAEEKPLYDENANARADIRSAVSQARKEHTHVVLDFGGNWCLDCHVLEKAMEQPELAPIVRKNFIVVHIDVGRFDKNLDIAEEYHVPLNKGVPALAVLDANGKLLYAQEQGEFEGARRLSLDTIKAFFEQWRPKK